MEVQMSLNESEKGRARFWVPSLGVLRVRPEQNGKFEDHALTDELGYPQRELSMHWPAVTADVIKTVALRRAS
jgi:hypothetical protein